MLDRKNKVLIGGLLALLAINTSHYAINLKTESQMNAGILQDESDYSDLTSSYFRIEGMVGDTISDFVIDYRGKTVNSFTVETINNSIVNTGKGLDLLKAGEGTAIFNYAGASLSIDYSIKANPDMPEPKEEVSSNAPPTNMNYKTCTLTSNGTVAKGVIMYIDDSKNAFKSTGTFYIEESFLDGKTHTIYVAKFTNKGPVAYAITQFTSLANDVNFMNYNESEVEINNLNINLKTDLNNLF